ncbi:MAG: LysR family transcriptional regulator [Planctomycetota bacterium]|nr:LysR family transcriptional regulator [Planctomycetota bacterium]
MTHALFKKLQPRIKVWIEVSGRPAFGDGKLRWLEQIEQAGSLRAAAQALAMSYRGLWGRLRAAEERLGFRLIIRQTGGAGGGGVQLTDDGRALVALYRRFREGLDELVAARFRDHLAPRRAGKTRRPRASKPRKPRK